MISRNVYLNVLTGLELEVLTLRKLHCKLLDECSDVLVRDNLALEFFHAQCALCHLNLQVILNLYLTAESPAFLNLLAVEETGLGRENLSATFEYLNLTLSAVSLTATSGRKENLVVGKRTHKVSARGNVEGLLAAVNVDFNSALRRDSCFYNQQDSHQNQDDDHHKRYS